MRWNEPYSAGRISSVIPASSTANWRPSGLRLVSTTRDTSAPEWPTIERPGSSTTGTPSRFNSGSTAAAYSSGVIIGRPSYEMPRPPPRSTCSMLKPSSVQINRQRHQGFSRALQRFRRRDLRSDVDVHADELYAGQRAALRVDRARVLQGHAELVALQTGRDVGVRPRIDVGVDAKRDARDTSHAARQLRDAIELAGATRR